ncbi:hypothetical protein PIB30_066357 [Stylosanthes scabra]|uniref:Uncharacterized protein n=1 Tax=Stylosanthes scabra TaxID=79078 RepID=A0ABU6WKQ7_9FABA|nr:hypothetical protein [Stylosanthes scabra]
MQTQLSRMKKWRMPGNSLTKAIQPAVPIQLRRTDLLPLAWGWQEFIIHSLVPTGNKSEITVARAILIHAILKGEDVRAEDIIADNMAVIAQGLHGKGNLSFSKHNLQIVQGCRLPRNVPEQQQDEDDEDEPMPQAGGGNEEEQEQQQYHHYQQPPQQHYQEFQQNFENQYHQDLQGIEEHLSSMQFLQQSFYENMQKLQADYMEEVKAIKANGTTPIGSILRSKKSKKCFRGRFKRLEKVRSTSP